MHETVDENLHNFDDCKSNATYLSIAWVDYVEEPIKYQALRPHFFSVVGWWWWWSEWVGFGVHGVLVTDVACGGGRMGDGGEVGLWCGWWGG